MLYCFWFILLYYLMHAGTCEQIKPFNFYSLHEFEYKQLISRGKYFVGAYQHIDTKMPVVVKEIPYHEPTLEVLKRVERIKSANIAGILGLCLYRAEVGWMECQRLKVEDKQKDGGKIQVVSGYKGGSGRKESRSVLLFMERFQMNLLEYVNIRKRNIQMFTVDEIKSFLHQMLSVLERLQREGISHRDVKPENILVHHENYLLCDFQDAIEVKTGERPAVDLTTVEYSSPEFLRFIRNPKDKYFSPFKLDVYALGLTLLFLCSMGKFSLEERTNFIYQASERSHEDFIKDQRIKWVRNQGQYKTFNSLIKLMLEEDEYKRDDFLTLTIKSTDKQEEDDNQSDYNLSDDNSGSKSTTKMQKLQKRRLKKLARERREQTLRRRELLVYGLGSLLLIVLFVLYCLL